MKLTTGSYNWMVYNEDQARSYNKSSMKSFHHAPTSPGSSGAPVILREEKAAIGIHVEGSKEDNTYHGFVSIYEMEQYLLKHSESLQLRINEKPQQRIGYGQPKQKPEKIQENPNNVELNLK